MKLLIRPETGMGPFVLSGVSLLVVYDGDTPIGAVWRRDDNALAMSRAGESDFERLLSDLGVNKRVVQQVRLE